MKTHDIQDSTGHCQIYVGESIQNMERYFGSRKPVVITDSNVRRCQGHSFSAYDIIEIEPGEQNKTLETVKHIYSKFIERKLDRSACVVAVGGGVVCDVTGFASSTFLSGLDFGYVPSTLLAQVDASLGGKNEVHFKGNKNCIGTLSSPLFVLSDTKLLSTLPKKELGCGIAEIVKHALIQSASLFEFLEQEWSSLLSLQNAALEKVISDSVVIKSWIVQSDRVKKGERAKLHFGHILDQAIKDKGQMTHGEFLSLGMVLASKISARRGMLSPEEVIHITSLLNHLDLPTDLSSYKESLLETTKNISGKKSHIPIVLLSEIGKAEVVSMTENELEETIRNLY